MSRLKDIYAKETVPALHKALDEKNRLALPRLVKVIVSSGVGRATQDSKHLETVTNNITAITGQKPVVTRARKSVAGFKLREGMPIGVKVTLRGEMMFEFLDRLIQVTLPRVRDFRGLNPKAFDGQGNYSIGLREVSVFPETSEVEPGDSHGLEITIVTTAEEAEGAEALLRSLGLPLQGGENG
jgi:large subunit ribosomal protein L5